MGRTIDGNGYDKRAWNVAVSKTGSDESRIPDLIGGASFVERRNLANTYASPKRARGWPKCVPEKFKLPGKHSEAARFKRELEDMERRQRREREALRNNQERRKLIKETKERHDKELKQLQEYVSRTGGIRPSSSTGTMRSRSRSPTNASKTSKREFWSSRPSTSGALKKPVSQSSQIFANKTYPGWNKWGSTSWKQIPCGNTPAARPQPRIPSSSWNLKHKGAQGF